MIIVVKNGKPLKFPEKRNKAYEVNILISMYWQEIHGFAFFQSF